MPQAPDERSLNVVESSWPKRVAFAVLVLMLFVGSFLVPVSLSLTSQVANLDVDPGRTTEGDTIRYRPSHTSNGIQEWETRRKDNGKSVERGIRVRADTPAEMETTWFDRNGDRRFESMEVSVSLGAESHAAITLNPLDAFSPIIVTRSTRNKVREYRDFNGGGYIDMWLDRVMTNGAERLVAASVQYHTGFHEIVLDKPFDDRACTIVMPDGATKDLVYEKFLWIPKERRGFVLDRIEVRDNTVDAEVPSNE